MPGPLAPLRPPQHALRGEPGLGQGALLDDVSDVGVGPRSGWRGWKRRGPRPAGAGQPPRSPGCGAQAGRRSRCATPGYAGWDRRGPASTTRRRRPQHPGRLPQETPPPRPDRRPRTSRQPWPPPGRSCPTARLRLVGPTGPARGRRQRCKAASAGTVRRRSFDHRGASYPGIAGRGVVVRRCNTVASRIWATKNTAGGIFGRPDSRASSANGPVSVRPLPPTRRPLSSSLSEPIRDRRPSRSRGATGGVALHGRTGPGGPDRHR